MNVLAIYNLHGNKEAMGDAVASALGWTRFEALSRLRVAGSGPLVMALFADLPAAMDCAGRLKTAGISAVVLTEPELKAELGARSIESLEFRESDLHLTSGGTSIRIPYSDIRVILHGTSISRSTTEETTVKRSFSLGRAVASGGLVFSKTTKKTAEVTTEEREGFLSLHGGGTQNFLCRENLLDYTSLGSALLHSRTANFGYIVAELRRLCPDAAYDNRLLNRTGQAGLLGPRLIPEKHLHVATALLARVLRIQ